MQTARTLPKAPRYAIGTIESVENARLSKAGVYSVLDFVIKGATAAMPDKTFYFSFIPELLDPNVNLEEYAETEEGAKLYGMFKRHVKNENENSTLQVILGDNYAAFEADIDALKIDDYTSEEALNTIAEVFANHIEGTTVGYLLKQDSEKAEDGTVTLKDGFKVDGFFDPSDESLEKIAKRVAKQRKEPKPVLLWAE